MASRSVLACSRWSARGGRPPPAPTRALPGARPPIRRARCRCGAWRPGLMPCGRRDHKALGRVRLGQQTVIMLVVKLVPARRRSSNCGWRGGRRGRRWRRGRRGVRIPIVGRPQPTSSALGRRGAAWWRSADTRGHTSGRRSCRRSPSSRCRRPRSFTPNGSGDRWRPARGPASWPPACCSTPASRTAPAACRCRRCLPDMARRRSAGREP